MSQDSSQLFFSSLRSRLRLAPLTVPRPPLALRDASVLAPLFWKKNEPWVYLTRRPLSLRHHPGQISFPGGGHEAGDVTSLHTALRETNEELGIAPQAVDVLGQLAPLATISSFWVTPFVGVVSEQLQLSPQPGEIDTVLEAPLWRLRKEKRTIFHAQRDVLVWDDGEHVVWGVTWHVLTALLNHVEQIAH